MLGFKDAPRCLSCLAALMKRERAQLAQDLFEYIRHRDCFWDAWNWANHSAGLPDGTLPDFLSALPGSCPAQRARGEGASTLTAQSPSPAAAAEWDAGEKGCGELVLELRGRLEALAPGQIIKLVAYDPAAPVDLPAWCRLTGHTLLRSQPPVYWIERGPVSSG
jgi:tRNA 2-thiouridine synthesizing protein A